ncbi:MAG TPA: ABC transporter permease [Ignavibacteriaceae bacterium]|nr:ABC transporter permease [Ignavibacteriaceae bacterium]
MKSGLKIIHWIYFLWFLIASLRFQLAGDYLSLIVSYCGLLVTDLPSAITMLSGSLIDAFLSMIIFLLTIPLTIIFKKRLQFLYSKLNFSFAFLILLVSVFLFAPIISNENPEFSKNLSVTKLLPPFSSVKQFELKSDIDNNLSDAEYFRKESEEVIKPSFNDNIILADSFRLSDKVIYYQKNEAYEIEKESLISQTGVPVIEAKFYLLGTDEFGRDLFARLIHGTRISITVGLGAVVLSFIIGIILGFIAGYRGGLLDVLLNRFTEIFLAFPVIYLIVLILALFGSSLLSVIVVLGISGWMSLFKIVKSEVLSIKQKDFFSTAELVGLSKIQLLSREILPVIIAPVLVNMVFLFSNVVLAEAALSYLGLGTGSSYPSWGSMISSGQEYITKAWWLIAFPGLGLILTLYTFNSSGRMLGKVLNPRLKK